MRLLKSIGNIIRQNSYKKSRLEERENKSDTGNQLETIGVKIEKRWFDKPVQAPGYGPDLNKPTNLRKIYRESTRTFLKEILSSNERPKMGPGSKTPILICSSSGYKNWKVLMYLSRAKIIGTTIN